jgi:hypothetical protein
MDIIYKTVAGLDVHLTTVVVYVDRRPAQEGLSEQVRTFGPMTEDLLQMSDCLLKA